MLKHIICFTHRHVDTKIDAYIYSYLNVEVSQYQHRFILNPHVEDLKDRDLALSTDGKVFKRKMEKRNLDSLVKIKAWRGLTNRKDRIKRLKDHV